MLDVSSCSFIQHTLLRAKAKHFAYDNGIKCVKLKAIPTRERERENGKSAIERLSDKIDGN